MNKGVGKLMLEMILIVLVISAIYLVIWVNMRAYWICIEMTGDKLYCLALII